MGRVLVRKIHRKIPITKAKTTSNKVSQVNNTRLGEFNPSILGLGELSRESREIDALAAVFDLAKFTTFCNQVDPHLGVPKYLSHFLDWLFARIREWLAEVNYGNGKVLWAKPPFFTKFLGDGVLFIWNTEGMTESQICKIVTVNYKITRAYREEFYPRISTIVDKPPAILRCGIARGKVFSVGSDRDYFGHCINTAARLQKLSLLTFCFPHRGFNIQNHMVEEYRNTFVTKRVSIRGVGENELVWVVKQEFASLPEKSQALFREP